MKVTFNNGYYIVKDGTRECGYRADILPGLRTKYEERIKQGQRALEDLEAIEQYKEEQS